MSAADAPWYEQAGRKYMRVTRIMDILRNPEIDDWRSRIGDAVADKIVSRAARTGKAAHALVMKRLRGEKIRLPKSRDVVGVYEAWQRWYAAQTDFIPFALERTLYGQPPYDYAGTPDCVEKAGVCGGTVNRIDDWKMTGRMSDRHFVQMSAYAPLAWPHGIPEDLTLRIVRIDPVTCLPDVDERPFNPKHLATFLKLVDVYRDWYFEPHLAAMAKLSEQAEKEEAMSGDSD